jgi:hypothetical protein
MDEGVIPGEAFPAGYEADPDDDDAVVETSSVEAVHSSHLPGFLSGLGEHSGAGGRSRLVTAGVVVVIVLIVAVVGVPAGWYSKNKSVAQVAEAPSNPAPQNSAAVPSDVAPVAPESSTDSALHSNEAALLAARREREARDREKAKSREEKADAALAAAKAPAIVDANADAKKQSGVVAAQRKVTVQVSYDENGRVTQASGGDATALRIARQKRFPAGKAGSATVTIPIN